MNEAPLLRVDKLEVVYHRTITAVLGISLAAEAGQIVAVLGTNGAGKSTTLRAISGFLGIDDARITDGSVTFKGRRRSASEEFVYDAFPRLADLRRRTAGLLSGGERQMLALGSALVCRPELLLVDELSLGLAPAIVEELLARLVQIRRDLGLTIVLVEQNAAAALAVADYGYVLENGRCVLDGDSARLRAHGDIQEFYLGLSQGGARASYRAVKQYRRSRRWYG